MEGRKRDCMEHVIILFALFKVDKYLYYNIYHISSIKHRSAYLTSRIFGAAFK